MRIELKSACTVTKACCLKRRRASFVGTAELTQQQNHRAHSVEVLMRDKPVTLWDFGFHCNWLPFQCCMSGPKRLSRPYCTMMCTAELYKQDGGLLPEGFPGTLHSGSRRGRLCGRRAG